MAEQSLDNDEQINVRWAYDDPNPRAAAVRLRNDAQTMLAAMEARGDLQAPLEYPEELEPSAKRQQLGDDGAAPMTREEHEAETLRQAAREEEAGAQLEAFEAEAQREAACAEVATNASRLDDILAVRAGSRPGGGWVRRRPLRCGEAFGGG